MNSFDANVVEHAMTLPLFGAVMIDYNILRPEREPIVAKLAARNLGILAGDGAGRRVCISKDRFRIRGIQDAWYVARAWKNHRADLRRRPESSGFLAQEQRLTAAEIALAWVLRKPEISCARDRHDAHASLCSPICEASGATIGDDLLQKISDAQSNFA